MSEINRRVFLVPRDNEEKQLKIITLKHPRTCTTVLCALDDHNRIYEMTHFKEEFSSWFFNELVIKDGSLFLLTQADPLFFLLPYFIQVNKFCRLDDIIVDESYPDSRELSDCCTKEDLLNVANSKELPDLQLYRYDNLKTLEWLKQKVNEVSDVLKKKDVNISDGSHAASLRSVKSEDGDNEKYVEYAYHLVSEYLSEDVSEQLFKALGLKAKEPESNETPPQAQEKRQKLGGEINPADDYSTQVNADALKNKQKSNLSAAQKRLLKTDKSGMKNISSFFQKK